MDRYTIAALLMVTGMILPLAAWKNFRKAGVPFWKFAPLLRIHQFLHPVGAFLYRLGVGLIAVGLLVRWLPV